MSTHSHLFFNINLGKQKPESIINRMTACPFCDRENLEGIIEERGSIILLKNKYPVLQDTYQAVLIETDQCNSELSVYSKEHLYELIDFSITKWLEMISRNEFKSVLLFKNHGPFSGGTIAHPHMQIVGLNHVDGMKEVTSEHFEGIVIDRQAGVELNVSTKPRMGFYEFNVILEDVEQLNQMADYIQLAAHYVLHNFNKNCTSYNLFFYQFENKIMTKIIPRFTASPLFVGYSIPQVSNNLEDVVRAIQSKYFR
jgi:galactose-1-phosphate uridylyltransferase